MSWRVIVISNCSKLDYKQDYMVVRKKTTTSKVHLSEISLLLIESTAVSLTTCLLCELTKRKVKIIFCDEKRNPCSELISYYGSHDTSAKIRKQIEWKKDIKDLVWTEIVTEKIRKQKEFLNTIEKKSSEQLLQYIDQVETGDRTNREGHAAKVYFNSVFGMDFTRTSSSPINAALNYGYGIILSAFNREIAANGYLTQLGLFHDNMFNMFNLGSDLMEPFRVPIDKEVYSMKPEKLENEEKIQLVNVLNHEVIIDGQRNYINNAIKLYTKSVFDALNENDISLIRFYRNEL
ncbi:MAG: type II CRISPR-associated endonuclease Cas1 [Candidatus Methanofastidiosa archaeon]|jgi:CRISPR-associated protein Cas1|nr:type II CRISPR-associated endonuclease Cas1 [Candidatus Methanofastidiosa archaeon]